ncbi:YitT family protein [Sutcliffiella deserti]|uniref:YitT family protein n=1 Tax=Sutcliffiella deserti TaxID=2875501 RepID=UPI001CBF849D|nr:YitT family protein [Sutcliffiella deserti]
MIVEQHVKKVIIVLIGAFLNAIAMNFFLIPADVYASGFTGVSQLIFRITEDYLPFTLTTGFTLLVLNIPVTILAWKKVGRSFTIYSFLSVFLMSFFLEIVPIYKVNDDILLNAVFGGVIAAVGVGLTLKWGASTGGLDIIAMILSRMKDKPVGTYFFALNSIIIITAGLVFGWEKALYTLVTLYASTRVIDAIHTRHEKLTAMIITKQGKAVKEAIHAKMVRGITSMPARGAFSGEDKEMLMMVITRYELYDLERILKEADPKAFTNVVQTTGIFGSFRKD